MCGSEPACGKTAPGYPVLPGTAPGYPEPPPIGSGSTAPLGSGGGCGLRIASIHQPASMSASEITPDPPMPTPTGPMVLAAIASATINTIVLVCPVEPSRRVSDSAIELRSVGSGNSSQPARYNTMPAPPKMVDTTKATRTNTGSTP